MPGISTPLRRSAASADGTTIIYETIGEGPSVIVIPGVLSTASTYASLIALLAKRFTVHTIERRGRCGSGPQGERYSIEKEMEDVGAVREQTGAAYLFGHSFGGLVALEYARNNPALEAIALYEPCISVSGSISTAWAWRYEALLAQRKPLDAFVHFSIAAGPQAARRTPAAIMKMLLPFIVRKRELEQMLELLPENLREHQQIGRLDDTFQNYREITAPVLLMYGAKSGLAWVRPAIEALSGSIPAAVTKEFRNLDHFGAAAKGAPEVANAVERHFMTARRYARVP